MILHSKIWQNVYFPEMWYQIQKMNPSQYSVPLQNCHPFGLNFDMSDTKIDTFLKGTTSRNTQLVENQR